MSSRPVKAVLGEYGTVQCFNRVACFGAVGPTSITQQVFIVRNQSHTKFCNSHTRRSARLSQYIDHVIHFLADFRFLEILGCMRSYFTQLLPFLECNTLHPLLDIQSEIDPGNIPESFFKFSSRPLGIGSKSFQHRDGVCWKQPLESIWLWKTDGLCSSGPNTENTVHWVTFMYTVGFIKKLLYWVIAPHGAVDVFNLRTVLFLV